MVTSPSPICVVIGSTFVCACLRSSLWFADPAASRVGQVDLPIVVEDLAPPKPSASGPTELRSSTNLPPKSMHQQGATVWREPPRRSSRRRGLRQERARKVALRGLVLQKWALAATDPQRELVPPGKTLRGRGDCRAPPRASIGILGLDLGKWWAGTMLMIYVPPLAGANPLD